MEQRSPPWQCPDRMAFVTWLLAIVMPAASFLTFTMPVFTCELSFHVPLLGVTLLLLSTLFMALTSFTNPGLIPRPMSPEAEQQNRLRSSRGMSTVMVNGVGIQTKFCHLCGIQRPPRASHCRITDRCIERWDHYCPWVGTAVGRRNYRWFVLFVFTAGAFATFVAVCSVLHLVHLGQALGAHAAPDVAALIPLLSIHTSDDVANWVRAIAAAPLSCVHVLYGAVVAFLLAMLGAFHVYLIAINQTTYEHMRDAYDTWESNPFYRGLLLNCCDAFCPACFPHDEVTAGESAGESARVAEMMESGGQPTGACSTPTSPLALAPTLTLAHGCVLNRAHTLACTWSVAPWRPRTP